MDQRSQVRFRTRARPRPSPLAQEPSWFKDAVIYQVHLKSFFDGNDDGIGDFPGLIAKLDYIAALGVNTIWLLPFYPSPQRDGGYDISDYRGVHPDYGTLADARRFLNEAHARGLRVITELVINHTSDQHPWFQRARLAPAGSAARNFYVWSDDERRFAGTRIIFVDSEKSNWTWDPVAKAYYWHRFYSHQPDLNFDNPLVLRSMLSVMRYWLALGVDGLRLDAVPYLVEREGTTNENLPETHAVVKRVRAAIDAAFPGRVLLAEANQWPEDVRQYFGNGDECHMAFHFPLMPRMYMALAQEDRFPLTDILRQMPEIPENTQWALFLRNHDELTLEMVTDRERDYLWERYAADRRARLNVGIRRRLAPLVERDRRRVELLNSLLLSMPGTPVIYYGDELGMGDNIHLGDRDGVRTPMQWSPDRNGGFSRADPASLALPPIMDPLYGYQAINVEAQSRDPHSLLNWTRRMLGVRSRQRAFGRGSLRLLYPANRRVMAYLREYTENGSTDSILCVANVSRFAQAVELDLAAFQGRVPVEMLGGAAFPPIGRLPYLLTLPPYGFYWFVLAANTSMPAWHVPAPVPMPEYRTLVVRHSLEELLAIPERTLLEEEILPAYLPKRRWFAVRPSDRFAVRIVAAAPLPETAPPILFFEIEVATESATDRYLLPVGFIAEDAATTSLPQQLALARVRRGRRIGFMTDAFALDVFASRLIALLGASGAARAAPIPPNPQDASAAVRPTGLQFLGTPALAALKLPQDVEVRRLAADQSNSAFVVGGQVLIKLFRRIAPGPHPEAEMIGYLTEHGYPNIAPLLGEIVRAAEDGETLVLGIAQGFIYNEGDGWTWALNLMQSTLQESLVLPPDAALPTHGGVIERFEEAARILGQRLGELHVVLGEASDAAAFVPRACTAADCDAWASGVLTQLDAAFAVISRHEPADAEAASLRAELLARGDYAREIPGRLARSGVGSLAMRIHGDLHLGQILVAHGDIYFIDFEGEPARPLPERRGLGSPLRDVAGMLRSFGYVAETLLASGTPNEEGAAIDRKRRIIEHFRLACSRAFTEAYGLASAPLAHGWANAQCPRDLLNLFLLEKAAYEVSYEAAHRPEWIGVPLRALLQLLTRI